MELLNHFLGITKYNLWANNEITYWLLSQDQDLMTSEVGSSFSTINKTIAHIWFAEHVWMQRLKGESIQNIMALSEHQKTAFIVDGLLQASSHFVTYLDMMTPSDLSQIIIYPTLKADEISNTPISAILQHIMNHSTYHRGQLITIGRSLGITNPPQTDFIAYFGQQDIK